MKAVFLNAGLVEALKAYGIKLSGSEGLTNLDSILDVRDVATAVHQTDRMMSCDLFSNLGITTVDWGNGTTMEDDEAWDVFLGEGSVSVSETRQRLNKLNCVVSSDETLVFFEDEQNEKGTTENLLEALSYILPLDDIMKSPVWQKHLKNC